MTACMAEGRGARFGSGLTVAEGGCTEPRSAAGNLAHLPFYTCELTCYFHASISSHGHKISSTKHVQLYSCFN